MTIAPNNQIVSAALSYADRGWLVFPVHTALDGRCSCKNPDCNAVAKHPRVRWTLQATTDSAQIASWWEKWPDANIGIVTGAASGVIVVDVDDKEGKRGSEALASIEALHGREDTLTASTGNGKHLYFAHPGGSVRGNVGLLGEGLDVRSDGNYVVAPPSAHANGNHYEFIDPQRKVQEAPEWLLNTATNDKHGQVTKNMNQQVEDVLGTCENVEEGNRNDTLFKLASALRGQHGKGHDEILSALLTFNERKCQPPLSIDEVKAIAAQVMKYPAEKRSRKASGDNPLWWFPFDIREWFMTETFVLMNDAQKGWHISLLAWAWRRGGTLPCDMDTLFRLSGASSRERFDAECAPVLGEYNADVVNGEELLVHKSLAQKFADSLSSWMQKMDAGKRSGQKRSANKHATDTLTQAVT